MSETQDKIEGVCVGKEKEPLMNNTDVQRGRWVGPRGHLIPVRIVKWRRCEVPTWLVDKLQAYATQFDWGKPMDSWEILRLIHDSVDWRNDWGSAILTNGVEVFLSCGIERAQHRAVATVAEVLDLSLAICTDGSTALAPSGKAWKEGPR